MANQFQTEPTLNPQQSTRRVVAARIKVLRLLSVAAVALFLLVGTAQADIFVSNYGTHYIEKWDDSGHVINARFIFANGASEGIACVKLMQNRIYVANNSPTIGVYDINTGGIISGASFTISGASKIAALAFNITGTRLYAADWYGKHIYAVDLPLGGSCTPSGNCNVPTPAAHDVVVGPDGNVYATEFDAPGGSGVQVFTPSLGSHPYFLAPGVPPRAGGMVFDGGGNLWVTSTNPVPGTAGIYKFAGPNSTTPNPGTQLNFMPDPNAFPLGLDVSPINPPTPPVDACKGCIVVAELNGVGGSFVGTVSQINPTTDCPANGQCTWLEPQNHPYFTTGGAPKYVHFSEDCCDTGYVEICKMSCLTDPVTGYFAFTAMNSGVSVGPLSIPVGACSGPIPIPNGTVTIHEAQQLGIEVTNITAYNYDYLGNQINALLSFNLPFQTGNVDVVSGDVSTETVAGFTNCASGPGELKICKVAGQGVQVGTLFSFTASGDPTVYQVPAGPAPYGYCVVGKSYPVGTPVTVTETGPPGYVVSNITVAPPDRGGHQTSNSVVAIIDSGTTEVTFTNTASGGGGCGVVICGVH